MKLRHIKSFRLPKKLGRSMLLSDGAYCAVGAFLHASGVPDEALRGCLTVGQIVELSEAQLLEFFAPLIDRTLAAGVETGGCTRCSVHSVESLSAAINDSLLPFRVSIEQLDIDETVRTNARRRELIALVFEYFLDVKVRV